MNAALLAALLAASPDPDVEARAAVAVAIALTPRAHAAPPAPRCAKCGKYCRCEKCRCDADRCERCEGKCDCKVCDCGEAKPATCAFCGTACTCLNCGCDEHHNRRGVYAPAATGQTYQAVNQTESSRPATTLYLFHPGAVRQAPQSRHVPAPPQNVTPRFTPTIKPAPANQAPAPRPAPAPQARAYFAPRQTPAARSGGC